ncbi:MAG TPA: Stp1/IreP family PP2C-type Ser/Thr phosphatase [Burkholderiaceae bacterium]
MHGLAFHARTDRGMVRDNNEDAVLCDPVLGLAVLADGMGGYQAGEVASAMATVHIAAELAQALPAGVALPGVPVLEQRVRSATENANRAIWQAATDHAGYSGMGTTVVVALYAHDTLVLAHVGDSRAYRLRQGQLQQVTRDHSYVQEQVDAGLLTPTQALAAPNRNLVTRALGVENRVTVDVASHALAAGDVWLLCTDGLTDMLTDADMAALLALPGNLAHRANALVDAANARGGRDNISVILVGPHAGHADPALL